MNICSTNRKKYKRAANAIVRKLNKEIKNDWLWDGRFVMKQDCAFFYPYEDKSGGQYVVHLIFKDTKTGREEYADFNNYEIDWRIWEWANKCITEYWDVWREDPGPYVQARLEGRSPN